MITRVGRLLLTIRRYFRRSERTVGLLSLPRYTSTFADHGLILIQIDGLSRKQFKHACDQGKLFFLTRLRKKENYQLCSLYSGLPSATPAVQAQIFYGVILSRPLVLSTVYQVITKSFPCLIHPQHRPIENRLEKEKNGVFKNSSVYSNIYRGGASETQFCSSAIG